MFRSKDELFSYLANFRRRCFHPNPFSQHLSLIIKHKNKQSWKKNIIWCRNWLFSNSMAEGNQGSNPRELSFSPSLFVRALEITTIIIKITIRMTNVCCYGTAEVMNTGSSHEKIIVQCDSPFVATWVNLTWKLGHSLTPAIFLPLPCRFDLKMKIL